MDTERYDTKLNACAAFSATEFASVRTDKPIHFHLKMVVFAAAAGCLAARRRCQLPYICIKRQSELDSSFLTREATISALRKYS